MLFAKMGFNPIWLFCALVALPIVTMNTDKEYVNINSLGGMLNCGKHNITCQECYFDPALDIMNKTEPILNLNYSICEDDTKADLHGFVLWQLKFVSLRKGTTSILRYVYILDYQTPNVTFRDYSGGEVEEKVSDFICTKKQVVIKLMYHTIMKAGVVFDNDDQEICFAHRVMKLENSVMFTHNGTFYLVPRGEELEYYANIQNTWSSLITFYVLQPIIKILVVFDNFVKQLIKNGNSFLKDRVFFCKLFLQKMRDPKLLYKIGKWIQYLEVACSIGDFFFSLFPASHLHLLYVMYICLLNVLGWFEARWDQMESPVALLFTFLTIVVGGYVIMAMQMHNLFKKSNAAIFYVKQNCNSWLYYLVQFLCLLFKVLLSVALGKIGQYVLSMDLVANIDGWYDVCNIIAWFLFRYMCGTFVIVFFLFLYMCLSRLRNWCQNKRCWPYSINARRQFGTIFTKITMEMSYNRFKSAVKFLSSYVVFVLLINLTFYVSWLLDFFESAIWFMWAGGNFLFIWACFCGVQVILGILLSFFSTNFFFEKIDAESNDFIVVIKYLINLHVLYFVDIVKRVLFCIFLIPFSIYAIVNHGIILCLGMGLIGLLVLLNLWVMFWAVSGMCQYNSSRRVLHKKCFAVRVYVAGVDARIEHMFLQSLAQSIPKLMHDTAIFIAQKDLDIQKFIAEFEQDIRKHGAEIQKFYHKLNSEIQISNMKDLNAFNRQLIEMANKRVMEQIEKEFKTNLARADARGNVLRDAVENRGDMEQWIQVAQQINDILGELLRVDVINDERFNQHIDAVLRRFQARQVNEVPMLAVADAWANLRLNFQENDWVQLLDNGLHLTRIRAINEDKIWAETEEQACLQMQVNHPEIPRDCVYNGVWRPAGQVQLKGVWEVREVSDKEEIVVKDVFGYFNLPYMVWNMLNQLWLMVHGYFVLYVELFLHGRTALTKTMVDLLYEVEFFPHMSIEDVRDLIFNQNASKFVEFEKKKIDLVLNLTYPVDSPKADFGHDFKLLYKNFCNRKIGNSRGYEILNFQQVAIPLTDMLDKANVNVLPRNIPRGLVLVSHLNVPYVMDTRFARKFGHTCALMSPFLNRRVCIGLNYKKNCFITGHVNSKLCQNYACGSPFIGLAEYGYCVEGERGLAICGSIGKTSLKDISGIDVSSHVRPMFLPIRSAYGVLCGDQIIGNAICVNSNGYKYVVTAAHVVSVRGDGKVFGPGDWSKQSVKEVLPEIIKEHEKRFKSEVVEEKGFIYPKRVQLESVCGEKLDFYVDKICGELAFLKPEEAVSLNGVPVSSREEEFNPEFLFVVDEGKPAAVPVVAVRAGDQVVLDYRSKGGYSGGAFFGNDKICAIHLGGTTGGIGMAYAKIYPQGAYISYDLETLEICDLCGGLHPLSIDCEEVTMHVRNQRLMDECEDDERVPFDKLGLERIYFSDLGGSILASIHDPVTGKKKYARYNYADFVEKGLMDLVDRNKPQEFIFRGGLNEFVDKVFKDGESLTASEIEKKLQSLVGGTVVNQIRPIESALYNELCNKIGENDLIVLLNKSLTELQSLNNSILDITRELAERKKQMQTLKSEFELDIDYQNSLREYRKNLADFLKEKKTIDEFNREIEASRIAIKQKRKDLDDKFNEEIEKLTTRKKKIIEEGQNHLENFKAKGIKIIKNIGELEEKKKQIKTSGLSEKEAGVNHKLRLIEAQLKNLKEEKKQLLAEKVSWSEDTNKFLSKLDEKINILKISFANLKEDKRAFIVEQNEKIKKLSEEKSKLIKDKPEMKLPELKKPSGLKPKMPKNLSIIELDEGLQQIAKAMKANSKVQSVVSELIKAEKEAKKVVDLGRLMEINNEEIQNQVVSHTQDFRGYVDSLLNKYLETRSLGIYSDQILNYFKTVCVWMVYCSMRDTELLLNEYCEECRPDFANFAEEIWLMMMEKLDLQESSDDEFVEIISNVINNQGLKTVYVNLTPQSATSRTFRANCLSPNQPAQICCSKCSWRVVCQENHEEDVKFKGTIAELGCVLTCLDKLVIDKNAHNAECNSHSRGQFSFSNNPIGVALACTHVSGKSERVNNCPLHLASDGNCLKQHEGRDHVKVIVDSQERFIDSECLAAFLFRMVKCNGECNRDISDVEKRKIMNMVSNSQMSKRDIKVGSKFFNLSVLSEKEKRKYISLLEDLLVEQFNCESSEIVNQNDIVEIIMARVDEKLESFLGNLVQSMPSTPTISRSASVESLEVVNQAVPVEISSIEDDFKNLLKNCQFLPGLCENNEKILELSQFIIKAMADKLNLPVEKLTEKRKVVNQNQVGEIVDWDTAKKILSRRIVSPAVFKDTTAELREFFSEVVDNGGRIVVSKVEKHDAASDALKSEICRQFYIYGENFFKKRAPAKPSKFQQSKVKFLEPKSFLGSA